MKRRTIQVLKEKDMKNWNEKVMNIKRLKKQKEEKPKKRKDEQCKLEIEK